MLHTLLSCYLNSRRDSLYIYVSLLLCRWLAESVYSICLRAYMRVPSFAGIYVPVCIHMCTKEIVTYMAVDKCYRDFQVAISIAGVILYTYMYLFCYADG